MKKKVIIIGGGFAGLTCAYVLAKKDFSVNLLEKRGVLGGRAYSFVDSITGDEVDNGQHVLMGCYENTIRFLTEIGSFNKLYFQKNLSVNFVNKNSKQSKLNCNLLPFPLNLIKGILGFNQLSFSDKIKILFLVQKIKKMDFNTVEEKTVADWLEENKYSNTAKKYFFGPVALAMLNEKLSVASLKLFVNSMKRVFNGKIQSAVVLPKVGLSSLYIDNTVSILNKYQSEINLNSEVASIAIKNNNVESIKLKNGRILTADLFVSAVPFFDLFKFLPQDSLNLQYFKNFSNFKPSPILSINLWFDKKMINLDFAGLVDCNLQWLFNKNNLFSSEKSNQYISLIISNADKYINMGKDEILQITVSELKKCFPCIKDNKVIHSLIIKEPYATISPDIDFEKYRPSFRTPISNLFLTGDWTNTGLPCTIESAVASGYACSSLICPDK